jgi:hypothetical protein
MDFEGAKDITRAMVIENSPQAFESMCLFWVVKLQVSCL